MKTFLLISVCFLFSYSFSQNNADSAKANKEALATLKNYISAIESSDVSKAISYLSNTKDFLVYENGKTMNYEEFTAALKTAFSQIKKAQVLQDTVYIRSVAKDAVLITGPYLQTVTDINNREFNFAGTVTFILLKRDGQWKLTYSTVVSRLLSN